MSDILIKGMEMPKTCCACFCARGNECGITRYKPTFAEWYEDGVKDCPLVPVPPHGRCVDADVLFRTFETVGWWDNDDRDNAEDILLDAPTIIPAEEGET